MLSRRQALVLVAVGGAAAAAGWFAGPRLRPGPDSPGVAALLAAPLLDLEGRKRNLRDWKDKVLVCNFWATWCSPCREEIPALNRIHGKFSSKGVEIVGIAIDRVANVVEFAKELKIEYTVVLAEASGIEVMRRLGNASGGLPFTVVLDRQSRLAFLQLGTVTEADLERKLASIV